MGARHFKLSATLAVLLVGGGMATVAVAEPANIAAAVASSARPAADTAHDAARKPAQMLAFANVRPGQTVVDLMPGAGYFTRLFSAAVGSRGHVYAWIPTEVSKFEKNLPADGAAAGPAWPNVSYVVRPINDFGTPKPVDMVWTSQNYHDLHDPFMGPADMARFDAAVYRALKPGGLFIVLDHAAAPGSGVSATNTLHRIDPAVVRKEVEAAGFVYAGASEVLRNPADKHTLLVFDPHVRGHTDQFIFKFRKPL